MLIFIRLASLRTYVLTKHLVLFNTFFLFCNKVFYEDIFSRRAQKHKFQSRAPISVNTHIVVIIIVFF